MGVLNVEPAGFHGLEAGLDLPAHPVGLGSFVGAVVGHQYLEFWDTVFVLHPCRRKIAHLSVDDVYAVEALRLPGPQAQESPRCLEPASRARLCDPEVLPDADVVADAPDVEVGQPVGPDELPVGHEAVYGVPAEERDVAFDDGYPFRRVGVPFLGQQPEQQRESHAFVSDAEHQRIDLETAELPVRPVHRERVGTVVRKQTEDEPGDEREVEGVARHEPLYATHVGRSFRRTAESQRQPAEADGLHLAQSRNQQRHEAYPCQVDCFAEMTAQYVE